MQRAAPLFCLLLAGLISCPVLAGDGPQTGQDSYATMLGYLTSTRIDGNAMRGVNGASAVNMSAGDLNLQANLRAIAVRGHSATRSTQQQQANRATEPDIASASIGGNAYADGSGLAAINQASGSRNAQLNAIAASLAAQGIREATDDAMASRMSASAGGHLPDGASRDKPQKLAASVEASAMRGFRGVMQLNQSAGSGNVSSNQLLMTLPAPSH